MPWHHIIPRHEWKRRFGNLNGFNAKDNHVNLSHENHTQLHVRYGEEGSKSDAIAGKAMSGKIIGEELQRQISLMTGKLGGRPKGFHHTKEWKEENSKRMRGNKHLLGHVTSKETKEKQRIKMLGNQHLLGHRHKEQSKQLTSRTLKSLPRLTCPNCLKVGGPANMKRYHFNNCKKK